MKAKDLLICTREDNYCIETFQMVKHPKINDVVEVEKVVKDEDGTWLSLLGYKDDMFDSNCFRRLSLKDINKLMESKLETV